MSLCLADQACRIRFKSFGFDNPVVVPIVIDALEGEVCYHQVRAICVLLFQGFEIS